MRVALCDRSEACINDIKSRLCGYELEIVIYKSVDELLKSERVFDLLITDTEDGRGLYAAEYAYNVNNNCIIVFYTDSMDYIKHGYEFHVFRYILKSEESAQISSQLFDALAECYKRCKYISGAYKGSFFNVFVRDIIYIDIFGHTATIHTVNGDYNLYTRMHALEEAVYGCGFIRCHRSYLVNSNFIHSIDSGERIVLSDLVRTTLPIGIRYKEFTLSEYKRHFGIKNAINQ